MKKLSVVFICIVMSMLLSSCSLLGMFTGKKAYEEGKLALAAGDYDEALSFFELAQNEGKKGKELEETISALRSYVTALDEYNKGNFETAKEEVESIVIGDVTKLMERDVDRLMDDIESGIELSEEIDQQILEAEKSFARGDYSKTETEIRNLEGTKGISKEQKDKLALLKQQLETAKAKSASATKTNTVTKVVYVDETDKENAKNAVRNFVYAYEAFVNNGSRNLNSYNAYMASYSPSWSSAYKNQWSYYNRHSISNYYVEGLSFESVTYDGKAFYVIDIESIGETKDGSFVKSTSKWKYTVIKDGGSFKVTNYTSAK